MHPQSRLVAVEARAVVALDKPPSQAKRQAPVGKNRAAVVKEAGRKQEAPRLSIQVLLMPDSQRSTLARSKNRHAAVTVIRTQAKSATAIASPIATIAIRAPSTR